MVGSPGDGPDAEDVFLGVFDQRDRFFRGHLQRHVPPMGTIRALPEVPGIWAVRASGRPLTTSASSSAPSRRFRGRQSVWCILSPRRKRRAAATAPARRTILESWPLNFCVRRASRGGVSLPDPAAPSPTGDVSAGAAGDRRSLVACSADRRGLCRIAAGAAGAFGGCGFGASLGLGDSSVLAASSGFGASAFLAGVPPSQQLSLSSHTNTVLVTVSPDSMRSVCVTGGGGFRPASPAPSGAGVLSCTLGRFGSSR